MSSEPLDIETWRQQELLKRLDKLPQAALDNPLPSPASESPVNSQPTAASITPLLSNAIWAPDTSLPEHLQAFDPFLGIDNLVDLWYFIYPEIKLYDWQAEELYRISGYTTGSPLGPRVHFFRYQPYLATYVAANGSGKDKVINAITAVGLPLLYRDTFVVATSSSHEQLKNQTEPHIKEAIQRLNARCGCNVYESVEFYHRCSGRNGEIKLFATDTPGRAEGWHPRTPIGRLILITNEAKSIDPTILAAMDRCRGYSHWLEVSSPGGRSGTFYKNWKRANKYPSALKAEPFKYFGRQVTYHDCPHISEAEAQIVLDKHGEQSLIYQTSFLANFYEEEGDVVIPATFVESCDTVAPTGDDIGIGLDCAAGGDETVVMIRRGNRLVKWKAFTESNIKRAANTVNDFLHEVKHGTYIFNADDGGVGRGFLDELVYLGWTIQRRHNQSLAYNKAKFLNLGAEIYWHTRDLFQARLIVAPTDDDTRRQLFTRKKDTQEGSGKIKLPSKRLLREQGIQSPDRADAFVLCFFSYRPGFVRKQVPVEDRYADVSDHPAMTIEQLVRHLRRPPLQPAKPKIVGTYTIQT